MTATTEQYLATYTISMQTARNFLLSQMAEPDVILAVAQELGLSNQMLADIYGGVSADEVIGFFTAAGLDSTSLDGTGLDGASLNSTAPAQSEPYADLKFMIEEEKMARDLYDLLYEATGLTLFDKIGDSEQKHFEAVLGQADRLSVDISDLETDTAGVFSDPELQSLYDQLLSQGLASEAGAVQVGIAVEMTDITDLQQAIANETDPVLVGVYSSLLDASYSHLSAFENLL